MCPAMSAHLALPSYQTYPAGSGMGYLEFYWNSAGEAGPASTSAGPAGLTRATLSPEAGRKRQNTGKLFQLSSRRDPLTLVPGQPLA